MMEIRTLHSLDTEYSADSIEWCPHPDFRSYFVCGTYQLEGDTSASSSPPCRRKGRIYLYKYETGKDVLTELYRIETAAILDMKWLQDSNLGNPILAAANALGQIEVFTLKNEELISNSILDLNPSFHNLLALSLDWQPSATNNGQLIASSDSKGDLNLAKFHDGTLTKLQSWAAHGFEAWICAFDKWNSNNIFTGGDDTFLHLFDIRSGNKQLTNKSHIAGVTSLLSHPTKENILLTGSYDERLRIFDTRSMRNPLTEIDLHGGIWRLKADPIRQSLILCACMYHNFSIVKITDESFSNVELVGEYNEHNSICYGADWCTQLDDKSADKLYMATCSFYDHKLCISSVV